MRALVLPLNDLIGDALTGGRRIRLAVTGRSMAPAIPDGATVELHPLTSAPAIGDVVAVRVGDRLVIHRIHVLAGGSVTTFGDALRRPDAPVPIADIVARVTLDGRSPPPLRRRARVRRRARRVVDALRRALYRDH